MNFERPGGVTWDVLEPLLDDALDQPPEKRHAWVRRNAASDEIANAVIALLAADARHGILDEELPVNLLTPEPFEDVRTRLATALDGRYRIEGVLGEGGSATVFLAHEVKHERPVVLKVLRPDVANWIGSDRFLREIHILAQLSHPHILGLIDSGDAEGLLYYVMPYVGGETLRTRLRTGALPLDDALPLLRDVAAALAYAHEQHIVHRDLKPENILIVGGHAFLMDFGIAKPEHGMRGATREGFAIGTPEYMAPEQASASKVDSRADVYSWGVVAAETLAGVRGGSIPKSIPDDLRRLIAQCLERNADERPRDGAALSMRLQPSSERPAMPRAQRRTLWTIAAAVVTIVVAGVAFKAWPRIPSLASVNGPAMVVPLTNETGDTSLAVWGRMAGDWLTQGLHQTGRVAVVPWPVSLQVSLSTKDRGPSDRVRAMAAETGAQTLVTGAYYLSDKTVRFQTQVIDVRNGSVLAALPAIEVPRDSIRAGIQQLRERLMAVFAIRSDQRLSAVPGLIDEPPTYEAYRQFERGIERFNALDYTASSQAFVDAWRTDTTFDVALLYAAMAYANNSKFPVADSLLHALQTRAVRLNPYHDLMLRYTSAFLDGDMRVALDIAHQAAATAPGGRAQYTLATIELGLGQIDEAIASLRGIDPDRGVMKGWAPYWYVLAHAQHLKGDYAGELTTSEEMRRRYPDSRAGWVHHVRALATLGKVAAADSVVAAASALPPDTYWSQGAMLVIIGEELDAHGFPGSQKYYQRAVTWLANQLARDPANKAHRYWMGSVQLDRGAPRDAAPYFESLAHDFPDVTQYSGLWGISAAFAGDTALARKRLGASPKYHRGEYLSYLARYAAIAGDTERSIALWSEAVDAGLNSPVWIHASARRELVRLAKDPRFLRLGIIPGGGM